MIPRVWGLGFNLKYRRVERLLGADPSSSVDQCWPGALTSLSFAEPYFNWVQGLRFKVSGLGLGTLL